MALKPAASHMKGELLTLLLAQEEGPDVHNCSELTCPARQETRLATGMAGTMWVQGLTGAQRGQDSPALTSVTITHLIKTSVFCIPSPLPNKIPPSPNEVLLLFCDQMATSVLHPIHTD